MAFLLRYCYYYYKQTHYVFVNCGLFYLNPSRIRYLLCYPQ